MKRTLFVVALVAGLSLFELALMLSCVIFVGSCGPWAVLNSFRDILVATQLLLIPAIAVLASAITYGRHGWLRRTLNAIGIGIGLLLAVLLAISLLRVAVDLIAGLSPGGLMAHPVLLVIAPGLSGILAGLVLVSRRAGKRSVEAERIQWLAERSSTRPWWRGRALRWSMFTPSLLVLVFWFCWPAILGTMSHLAQPQAELVGNYRVPVPLTWLIRDHAKQAWTQGYGGNGLCRGNAYCYPDCAWTIGFGSGMHDQVEEADWTPTRQFAVEGTSLNCMQRSWRRSRVLVQCSSPTGLYAGFFGTPTQLPTFYRMLSGITRVH